MRKKKVSKVTITALAVATGLTTIGIGASVSTTEHSLLGTEIMGIGAIILVASLLVGAVYLMFFLGSKITIFNSVGYR